MTSPWCMQAAEEQAAAARAAEETQAKRADIERRCEARKDELDKRKEQFNDINQVSAPFQPPG